ncbi:MAG: alkaline phosphatase family protein [Leptospiraceae bacterium]|nr:alkaline phosphatase family protein [Leptospiraceae bacterium]
MHSRRPQHLLKQGLLPVCIIACWAIICCSPEAGRPEPNAPRYFVIVSIDALHPDGVRQQDAPFLNSIRSKGWSVRDAHSIQPPLTLFNHAAMFTGQSPAAAGLVDNAWSPDQPQVQVPTIFQLARRAGLQTAFFYSKPKLGFLINSDIMIHKMAGPDSIQAADDYLRTHEYTFVFLHVSGLDYSGPRDGWLSVNYLAVLSDLDRRLQSPLQYVMNQKRFVILITSDHSGHDLLHGTDDPRDSQIPFIYYSDFLPLPQVDSYRSSDLFRIVGQVLQSK